MIKNQFEHNCKRFYCLVPHHSSYNIFINRNKKIIWAKYLLTQILSTQTFVLDPLNLSPMEPTDGDVFHALIRIDRIHTGDDTKRAQKKEKAQVLLYKEGEFGIKCCICYMYIRAITSPFTKIKYLLSVCPFMFVVCHTSNIYKISAI